MVKSKSHIPSINVPVLYRPRLIDPPPRLSQGTPVGQGLVLSDLVGARGIVFDPTGHLVAVDWTIMLGPRSLG